MTNAIARSTTDVTRLGIGCEFPATCLTCSRSSSEASSTSRADRVTLASSGIHIWHMPALVDIFGDDAARNSGVKLAQRGAEIIREACQFSPELAAAADVGPG
jgi:hypothetical protein